MRRTRAPHFGRVCVVNAVVVRLTVMRKNILDARTDLIAVHIERFFRHTDSAERLQRALERSVRLNPHDFFEFFVEISRFMAVHARHGIRVRVVNAAARSLLFGKLQHLLPKRFGRFRRRSEERAVSFIRGIVALNKIAHVNFVAPFSAFKSAPCLFHNSLLSVCKIFLAFSIRSFSGGCTPSSGYGIPSV